MRHAQNFSQRLKDIALCVDNHFVSPPIHPWAFGLFATVPDADINIGVQVGVQSLLSFFVWIYLEVELLAIGLGVTIKQ